ncbi:hypothetical protein E1B28_011828 [Marasmius oreades]|uniref:Uncharacterized protein n=1 Tax=Marasmius oreades TaxID=181124 RepID=A0A9P7UQD1_9AGAR|nr:uncharacterized protein E1B28_011828 [Marasmius oreades]KAG7090228.1 hypothetical protein E1B28_011828 [Marasmius oreades]
MWNIMEDCWEDDPYLRPAASEVLTRVARLQRLKTGSNIIKPAPNWDTFNLARLQNNVKYPVLDTAELIRLQDNLKSPTLVRSPVPHLDEIQKPMVEDGEDEKLDGVSLGSSDPKCRSTVLPQSHSTIIADAEKAVRALGEFDDLRRLVESVLEDKLRLKRVLETKWCAVVA